MAKTTAEKIESIKAEMAQLEHERKRLVQVQREQERKARTKRLCQRAGLLESMVPATIALTDDQFKLFLEKTISSEYGRKTLAAIAEPDSAGEAPNPAPKVWGHAASGSGGQGGSARVTG